CQQYDDFPWTF
nr:immunoglobulin light chain junction region [Macaca mulatta]